MDKVRKMIHDARHDGFGILLSEKPEFVASEVVQELEDASATWKGAYDADFKSAARSLYRHAFLSVMDDAEYSIRNDYSTARKFSGPQEAEEEIESNIMFYKPDSKRCARGAGWKIDVDKRFRDLAQKIRDEFQEAE